MSNRRAVIAIVGSALVLIAAVLVIVFVAIIPLPEFDELRPGLATGRIAFVTDADDCVTVADLQLDMLTELSCEYPFPEGLSWSRDGVHVVVFSGGPEPIQVTLDPVDGSELDAAPLDSGDVAPPEGDPSFVRRGRDEGSSIIGPDSTTVLTLEGPETYVVEAVATNPEETWIAFVDSLGRLAVFEIGTDTVYLVTDEVRGFPTPVWEP